MGILFTSKCEFTGSSGEFGDVFIVGLHSELLVPSLFLIKQFFSTSSFFFSIFFSVLFQSGSKQLKCHLFFTCCSLPTRLVHLTDLILIFFFWLSFPPP